MMAINVDKIPANCKMQHATCNFRTVLSRIENRGHIEVERDSTQLVRNALAYSANEGTGVR